MYKITSLNNPELVYYGHTCQTLARRFATHKSSYNTSTSKIIIEKGDAVILLIEDFPCESEDQARTREAFYVLNNPCVNKNVPGRNHKDSYKNWYDNNKEYDNERCRQYQEAHKEEMKEYQRQYYQKKKTQQIIIV